MHNKSNKELRIPKHTYLGRLEEVNFIVCLSKAMLSSSAAELEPKLKDPPSEGESVNAPFEIDDLLTVEQKNQIAELLKEHSSVFSKSDDDIGYIPDFKMSIQLKDDTPVRQTYISIPNPLYEEGLPIKLFLASQNQPYGMCSEEGWITQALCRLSQDKSEDSSG